MKRRLAVTIFIALIIFSRLSAAQPKPTARDYFNRAAEHYLLGLPDQALKEIEASLRLNPKFTPARELLESIIKDKQVTARLVKEKMAAARALLANGDLAGAETLLNEILTLSPGNVEAAEALMATQKLSQENSDLRLRYLLVTFLSLLIGLTTLVYLSVWLSRSYRRQRKLRPKKIEVCFNCGAKISPNTDICPNCGAWIGSKMRSSISKEQQIWFQKTGWRKNPFTLDIHPELFTGYRNEVKQILEKVAAKSGHILITGPLGVGKTTLLRWLANYLEQEAYAVYIPRPPQAFDQVIGLVIQALGVKARSAAEYDIYHLDQLRRQLGKSLVLLMDEAHEFSIEIERPLRTLGDLDEVKLVMAGLPETKEKFKNEIRPLFERLVLAVSLERLNSDELRDLIIARIENAGGEGIHPFSTAALAGIFELAQGIPRKTIKLCDAAVTRAVAAGEDRITPELVAALDLSNIN